MMIGPMIIILVLTAAFVEGHKSSDEFFIDGRGLFGSGEWDPLPKYHVGEPVNGGVSIRPKLLKSRGTLLNGESVFTGGPGHSFKIPRSDRLPFITRLPTPHGKFDDGESIFNSRQKEPHKILVDGESHFGTQLPRPHKKILNGETHFGPQLPRPLKKFFDGETHFGSQLPKHHKKFFDGETHFGPQLPKHLKKFLDGESPFSTRLPRPHKKFLDGETHFGPQLPKHHNKFLDGESDFGTHLPGHHKTFLDGETHFGPQLPKNHKKFPDGEGHFGTLLPKHHKKFLDGESHFGTQLPNHPKKFPDGEGHFGTLLPKHHKKFPDGEGHFGTLLPKHHKKFLDGESHFGTQLPKPHRKLVGESILNTKESHSHRKSPGRLVDSESNVSTSLPKPRRKVVNLSVYGGNTYYSGGSKLSHLTLPRRLPFLARHLPYLTRPPSPRWEAFADEISHLNLPKHLSFLARRPRRSGEVVADESNTNSTRKPNPQKTTTNGVSQPKSPFQSLIISGSYHPGPGSSLPKKTSNPDLDVSDTSEEVTSLAYRTGSDSPSLKHSSHQDYISIVGSGFRPSSNPNMLSKLMASVSDESGEVASGDSRPGGVSLSGGNFRPGSTPLSLFDGNNSAGLLQLLENMDDKLEQLYQKSSSSQLEKSVYLFETKFGEKIDELGQGLMEHISQEFDFFNDHKKNECPPCQNYRDVQKIFEAIKERDSGGGRQPISCQQSECSKAMMSVPEALHSLSLKIDNLHKENLYFHDALKELALPVNYGKSINGMHTVLSKHTNELMGFINAVGKNLFAEMRNLVDGMSQKFQASLVGTLRSSRCSNPMPLFLPPNQLNNKWYGLTQPMMMSRNLEYGR